MRIMETIYITLPLIWFTTVLHVPTASCGVLTERDRLYTDIFTNYSAKTLPVLNHTDLVVVKVTAFISNINNFDELSGDLSVTMPLLLQWKEERISWVPSDYDGITSISVSSVDLWRPQMFLLESSDSVIDICNMSIKPKLFSDGAVSWNSANVLKISCSVDVKYFPYDAQTCEVTILSWDILVPEVVYVPFLKNVQQTYFKVNSQWELAAGELGNCTDNVPPPCLKLMFILNRRSGFYVIYIMVPLIFLSLINNLVFLMPPNSGERTSVAVTAFLSFVVYMDIVNNLVPQSSDPVAYIYYYIIFLMVYSCCIMFLCIISLRIYDRHTDVPRWLQTLIKSLRCQCLRASNANAKGTIPKRKRPHMGGRVQNVTDITKTDLHNTEEFGEMHSTDEDNKANLMNTHDFNVTWQIVGNTFDRYCCTILYILVIAYTTILYIRISTNI